MKNTYAKLSLNGTVVEVSEFNSFDAKIELVVTTIENGVTFEKVFPATLNGKNEALTLFKEKTTELLENI